MRLLVQRVARMTPLRDVFDDLVVGAGSAGGILASRLTEAFRTSTAPRFNWSHLHRSGTGAGRTAIVLSNSASFLPGGQIAISTVRCVSLSAMRTSLADPADPHRMTRNVAQCPVDIKSDPGK